MATSVQDEALDHAHLLHAWGLLRAAAALHENRVACYESPSGYRETALSSGSSTGCVVTYSELYLRAQRVATFLLGASDLSRGKTVRRDFIIDFTN
jgi:acyl-CoA synthetase (AMP-forming)/AMP-acid ligase II